MLTLIAALRWFAALTFGLTAAFAAVTPPAAQSFGRLPDGRAVELYRLTGPNGFRADIMTYGAVIVRLDAPDREGRLADVTLGFDNIEDYLKRSPAFGAICGRVANRILEGRFAIDGVAYQTPINSRANGVGSTLHGGPGGFHKVLWRAEPLVHAGAPAVRLRYTSPDGDQGFPGELDVAVLYSLTPDGGLRIDYSATTTKPTPLNLTNHAYFNLKGEGEGDVLDHVLEIRASHYTPITPAVVPTGEIAPVKGTPFDFLTPQRIGARIDGDHEQLQIAKGYDHNFVLDAKPGTLALAAIVHEPTSGRVLEVLTTEPGVQLFTANGIRDPKGGKARKPYIPRAGFCLETQHFPNSINEPRFPNTVLRPGTEFRSTTIYRFTAR